MVKNHEMLERTIYARRESQRYRKSKGSIEHAESLQGESQGGGIGEQEGKGGTKTKGKGRSSLISALFPSLLQFGSTNICF